MLCLNYEFGGLGYIHITKVNCEKRIREGYSCLGHLHMVRAGKYIFFISRGLTFKTLNLAFMQIYFYVSQTAMLYSKTH